MKRAPKPWEVGALYASRLVIRGKSEVEAYAATLRTRTSNDANSLTICRRIYGGDAMSWVRLWVDMPTDPKFRVIAKKAGRPLSEVLSVFVFMMTNAGANANERGELSNWSDEDVAAALDIETQFVTAIREAMQGKTLDGDRLRGWEKRQPKREDGAAERAKAWRERKRTQTNAPKRPDTDSDTEIDSESEVIGPPGKAEQVAASGPDEISGLNGSTKLIVEQFAGWLNPWSPDLPAAHKSIADAVQIYGSQAVRDGFADLKADHADGKVRAMTVKAFYGFVRTAKERGVRPAVAKSQTADERSRSRQRELLDKLDAQIAAAEAMQ